MKKFLAIIIGALFVLSFAASAFAIHAEIPEGTQATMSVAQIKLSGQLKIWQWWREDIAGMKLTDILDPVGVADFEAAIGLTPGTLAKLGKVSLPVESKSSAFYKQRMRLRADIKLSDNVMGQIELESGPAEGGSEFWTWGENAFNAKSDQVAIRNAWILYKGSGLLGFPAGIKMGHMPLKLGHGKFFNQTRYGDDAIVLFADPTKQLHVGLLTIKVSEGAVESTSYTGVCYSTAVVTVGGTDYTYVDDIVAVNTDGTCPAGYTLGSSTSTTTKTLSTGDNTDDIDAYTGLFVYKIDDNNSIGANYTYINYSDAKTKFQNFMAHAAGNIAGLGYKAEVDLQFGDVWEDLDAGGYALWLALNYKLDPVNLRASFALGSGDDDFEDDEWGEFINFLGPDKNVAWIYEYQVATSAIINPLTMTLSGNRSGIANTTYYNVGADFALAKDLKASVDGWLFQATETADDDIDDDVGYEIDAKLVYKIAKNLSYTVMAGYFNPGDYYEDMGSYVGLDPKSVTSVRGDLTLNF